MKKLLILIIVAIFYTSCDSRKFELNQVNTPAIINEELTTSSKYNSSNNTFYDTIVYKENKAYPITVSFNDENNDIENVYFNYDKSIGVIKNIKGEEITEPINGETYYLFANNSGNIYFTLNVVDKINNIQTFNYSIYFKPNILPIAKLSIEKIGDLGEYKIIADESFDEDGKIIEYIFTVPDRINPIITKTSTINYVFASNGIYTLKLKVKDDSDYYSEEKSFTIEAK